MQEYQQNLDQVVVVNLDVSLVTANRKAKKEEIGVILPDDVFAGGVIKMFSPSVLNPMNTLKSRAESVCDKAGIRFLGSYAIPLTKVKEVVAELSNIEVQFGAAKRDFMANYVREVDEWIAAHPDQENLLRAHVLDRDHLETRINFDFQVYRIQAAQVEQEDDLVGGAADLEGGLSRASGKMSDQLLKEIAQKAKETIEMSLLGRDKVTQKALSPLKAIREKMKGLQFLDPKIGPIIENIDDVLDKLELVTPIDGMNLYSLHGVMHMLASVERMREHGAKVLAGRASPEVVDEIQEEVKIEEAPAKASEQPVETLPAVILTTEASSEVEVGPVSAVTQPSPVQGGMSWDDIETDIAVDEIVASVPAAVAIVVAPPELGGAAEAMIVVAETQKVGVDQALSNDVVVVQTSIVLDNPVPAAIDAVQATPEVTETVQVSATVINMPISQAVPAAVMQKPKSRRAAYV